MATQNFINECKNRANANRLAKFNLQCISDTPIEIIGETTQETTRGLELLEKDGFSTPQSDTDYWATTNCTITSLGDGWGRITATNDTNSNKWCNVCVKKGNMELEEDTKYTFVVEMKNVSGYSAYKLSQGHSGEVWANDFNANLNVTTQQKFLNKTKSDFSSASYCLRTFFTLPANTTGTADVRIMIVKGDYTNQDIEYEYYTGGIPSPNPDYPQTITSKTGVQYITQGDYSYQVDLGNIELNKIGTYQDSIKKSTGKNLFDKNNTNKLDGYINSAGTITYQSTQKTIYIKCKTNTTYTISKIASQRFAVASYSSVPTISSTTSNFLRDNTATKLTLKTGLNDIYLAVYYYNNTLDTLTEQEILDSIMINEGSTTLPYEPYGKVWYITKQTGRYNIDTSQITLRDYSNLEYGVFPKATDFDGYGVYGHHFSYCDKASSRNPVGGWNSVANIGGLFSGAETGNWWVGFTEGTGLDTIKTALTDSYIIYPLASPTYEVITDETLISQLETATFEANQSNYITKIELKDSCYVNDTIIGATYTKSADVSLLNLPLDTKLEGQTISPQIGVRYSNNSEEYVEFDNYTIESIKDEQTKSSTGFTAMNGGVLLDREYNCTLSFENGTTHTIYEFYQDLCNQLGLIPTDQTFDNDDIVMTGNPFQSKETCRVVLIEIEKVSCTIADIDWKNATISLTWLSDQIDYEFNTSDYSTLEGSFTQYGPLNTIILGNSQFDGENVVMVDQESVAEYGEHQIMIDASYFLYTEELRSQAIQAIFDKLDGLTYYDIRLVTPYGKPFLKIGNKIRINTNEEQVYDTYVLTHTFTYDGTFQSIIESPALTTEEQKVKNVMQGNSIKERILKTEVVVDKISGDITATNERVTEIQDEFGNYYTIDQTNTAIANAEHGITNTFSEAGGNNIFRNTGLWFANSEDQLNPYEFWEGNVVRYSEERAANHNALLLQNTTLSQSQTVPNGNYIVSFKYKKLIENSDVSIFINGTEYELNQTSETEFVSQPLEVTSQQIKIDFVSDTDNACEIYDLMVNAGSVKLAYSQNQNETTTDTVNISKGITITSSDNENIVFKANYDGVRIYDKNDMNNPITKFTDKGIDTDEITVDGKSEISGLLFQKIGNQIWISKL